MTNEYLDSFNGLGKSAIEATKELVEINGRLMSKILENQIKLANSFVESSEKQVASVSQNSDPKDFVATQAALLEEYAGKLADAAQSNAQLARQASEEMKSWFEKGVKTADQNLKNAAKASSATPTKTTSPKPATPKPSTTKSRTPRPAAKKTSSKRATATKTAPAPATKAKPVKKPATKKTPAKTAAKTPSVKTPASKPAPKK